jgi:hypothetical protein
VDKNGLTPLFLAASTHEHEETIQEFLRHPKSDWKYAGKLFLLFNIKRKNSNDNNNFFNYRSPWKYAASLRGT